jgi:hypothetical protein
VGQDGPGWAWWGNYGKRWEKVGKGGRVFDYNLSTDPPFSQFSTLDPQFFMLKRPQMAAESAEFPPKPSRIPTQNPPKFTVDHSESTLTTPKNKRIIYA